MHRTVTYCLLAALTYSVVTAAQALPMPQSDMSLSGNQWKESEMLGEAVTLMKRGERQQAKVKLAQFLKRYPNDARGPELAGMILLEEKNYAVAAYSFERAISLQPNNPGAYSKLGVSLLLQDKNKEAETALNKAISLRPGEPLARRYLGWLAENHGKLNGAGLHYVAALTGGDLPAGTLTDIHLALGRIYNLLGRHEQTVRLLAPYVSKTDTLNQPGRTGRVLLALAYLELKRGAEAAPLIQALEKNAKTGDPELNFLKAYAQLDSNPAGAREKLQSLAKSHPGYAGRVRLLIARTYAIEGKNVQAAKELENLAAQVEKSDLPEVLTALVTVHLSGGRPAEAGKVLDAYARKHPDIPEIAYLLAETKLRAGETVNAQAVLKKLIARQPNYAQAYALLGKIERSQNALPKAEEYLRKALSLDNNLANAWVDLAGVYVSQKDLAKAQGALTQGLKTNPGNALLQYELANIYDAMGKVSEANALYRAILAAYPDYLPALNNIALNLADQGGDLVTAKRYADKAYQIDKSSPAVQDTYGWILVLDNNLDKGLPLLEQAARSLPSDPNVLYHLGVALAKVGKTDEAKRYLQRARAAGLPENLRNKAEIYLK